MFTAPKWYDKEKVYFVGKDADSQGLVTGQQVFVRRVTDEGVEIVDPWDAHIRLLVGVDSLEIR